MNSEQLLHFSELAWPIGVSELYELGQHTLQYVPCEMFTFLVQQHSGDSIVIHDVGSSYDNDISSHDELGSLHMDSVLGIYLFSWLI